MTPMQELFVYWVQERYEIFCNKEAKMPKPWSDDPIFQSVYFTNVHREDDRTTRYIRNQWVGPYNRLTAYGQIMLVPALVFARMINWVPSLDDAIEWQAGDCADWVYTMKQRRARGKQVFSGAYLITTCGVKMDKLDYVLRVCEDVFRQDWSIEWAHEQTHPNTCEYWHKRLLRVNGLGSFLAAQVIADLKHTIDHPLSYAEDWWTFVAQGPGSTKGLNYFFDRNPDIHMADSTFKKFLTEARSIVGPALESTVPKMCNQDLQNCFCEFSKYVRVKNGGRTKRNYGGK